MPPIVFFLWPVSTEMYRGCTSVAEVTVMRRVRKTVAHNKKKATVFRPFFFLHSHVATKHRWDTTGVGSSQKRGGATGHRDGFLDQDLRPNFRLKLAPEGPFFSNHAWNGFP